LFFVKERVSGVETFRADFPSFGKITSLFPDIGSVSCRKYLMGVPEKREAAKSSAFR
jgi:hypothetical protein